jgi:hypothetical protein
MSNDTQRPATTLTTTSPASATPAGEVTRPADETRYANAQAASHGFGAGKVQASRLVAGWTQDVALREATLILENLDLAQAYAERAGVPFEDYVNGLKADEDLARTLTPDRLATLEMVFVTGFDIGFRACLVERLDQIRTDAQTEVEAR